VATLADSFIPTIGNLGCQKADRERSETEFCVNVLELLEAKLRVANRNPSGIQNFQL
jgi:hypothetical protein